MPMLSLVPIHSSTYCGDKLHHFSKIMVETCFARLKVNSQPFCTQFQNLFYNNNMLIAFRAISASFV